MKLCSRGETFSVQICSLGCSNMKFLNKEKLYLLISVFNILMKKSVNFLKSSGVVSCRIVFMSPVIKTSFQVGIYVSV